MEEIQNRLNILTHITFRGATHLKIWKRLLNNEGICYPDEEVAKKFATTFFAMSQKAHFEAAFMHLSRLLDSSKKATSIHDFLKIVELYPNLS